MHAGSMTLFATYRREAQPTASPGRTRSRTCLIPMERTLSTPVTTSAGKGQLSSAVTSTHPPTRRVSRRRRCAGSALLVAHHAVPLPVAYGSVKTAHEEFGEVLGHAPNGDTASTKPPRSCGWLLEPARPVTTPAAR